MKNKLLEDIISDVCIHENVKDGIVDFSIQEHIDALISVLKTRTNDINLIREITNKINEGKYPDRQAYNREGFLVTFPNPEYKKKALSTGEYSNQDPTHGKGGMHLIKKVSPTDVAQPSQKPVQTQQSSQEQPKQNVPPVQPVVDKKPQTPSGTENNKTTQDGSTQYSTGIPQKGGTDLKLDKITDYRDPSFEWVHNRKWEKRENNNYYDNEGNLKAITGLDGTVVPVSEEERVDLKKFIEDKKKEKLGIQPTDQQ